MDDGPQRALPTILSEGRTPSEWVEVFAERGLDVSERTLREKANRLGACHKLGRAMIITPDQLDTILRDGKEQPAKFVGPERSDRPVSVNQALEHLRTRQKRRKD